jgi:hypothetical protein
MKKKISEPFPADPGESFNWDFFFKERQKQNRQDTIKSRF